MFDNIIGRENLISQLINDINKNILPSSLLFYGDSFSGKLTTALELSRILTCDVRTALWNCKCRSCTEQRILSARNMLLLGYSDFIDEICACAEVLKRTEMDFARYLFIRSVRKMIKRFDPVLYDGSEPRFKKVKNDLSAIEELLLPLIPGNNLPDKKVLERITNKVIDHCEKVSIVTKGENIPVNQIRRIAAWTHRTSAGDKKVIILESADKMMESSRNSLLKILEEPPSGVYFILLASSKGGIIPTILSRVRQYHFKSRSPEVLDEVFTKIFREEPGTYKSIREYFFSWQDINLHTLKTDVNIFISTISGKAEKFDIQKILDKVSEKKIFKPFLFELSKSLQTYLFKPDPDIDLDKLQEWNRLINETLVQSETFNQNISLLIDSLFYRMKEH